MCREISKFSEIEQPTFPIYQSFEFVSQKPFNTARYIVKITLFCSRILSFLNLTFS